MPEDPMRSTGLMLAGILAGSIAVFRTWTHHPETRIVVIAGMPTYNGDGMPATKAFLGRSADVCVDRTGNIYIADTSNNRVRMVDARAGLISTVVGTGAGGHCRDGMPARRAKISGPNSLVLDQNGNLLVCLGTGHRIVKVDAASGRIQSVAGTGRKGYNGDGIPAREAILDAPRSIAMDGEGNLFIAEFGGHRIRKVDGRTGLIKTVMGNGLNGSCADGTRAVDVSVGFPTGVAVDHLGRVHFTDGSRIRMIDHEGLVRTVAGTGEQGYNGDHRKASTARLGYLESGMGFDPAGSLWLTDFTNGRIRRIDAKSGLIMTVAGTGLGKHGNRHDGLPATRVSLVCPTGLDVDGSGNIYFIEQDDNCVRRIDARTGMISTVAGVPVYERDHDGVAATSAWLWVAGGLAVTGAGDLLVSEGSRIRRVDALTQRVSTVAGTGEYGFNGDGIPATKAQMGSPHGIALDEKGNIFLADTNEARVRRIDAVTGMIATVAGGKKRGYNGDNISASRARLKVPIAVALDTDGHLYIADQQDHRVRRVDAVTGLISTVAGTGKNEHGHDGVEAVTSAVSHPSGIAFNRAGDMYILDSGTGRLRRVDARTSRIETVAGGGNAEPRNGIRATRAKLGFLRGIAIDQAGDIYLAGSWETHRVYRIDAGTGLLWIVAGTAESGYSGGDVPSSGSLLHDPSGLAFDARGDLFVADAGNYCIRKIILHPQ